MSEKASITFSFPPPADLLAALARAAAAFRPARFGVVVFQREGGSEMGQITVKDSDQPFGASVTFLDAKGAQTQPDDVPQWNSDNESAATVAASEDGLSATVTPGLPGAAVVSVSSTGADGTVVTSQGTVTVQPGEAVIGDVEFTPAA